MSESIRALAYRVINLKDNRDKLRNLEAPAMIICDVVEEYGIALAEFKHLADSLGMSEVQRHELLQENEEYIKARGRLSDVFQQMPSSRLFGKFFDYQYRWCFEGGELNGEDDIEEDDKLSRFNRMSVAELEDFIDTNPEPDKAMRALGILANMANDWSQDLLVEFHLLAARVRKLEQENLSRDEAVGMIQDVLDKIEEAL